jgi:drug/metabolite transporter (DMT)-like permease
LKELIAMGKYEWLIYVALAGLSWGTYVPLIFYGGNELGGKPGSRFMAILCVGVAYFFIAVLFPLYIFLSKQAEWPPLSATGLVFSGLAGVAGAVGALCVIFATKSAIGAAKAADVSPETFRLYIAPLIFGLAPVINTLVSVVWHPKAGQPFHFDLELPGWKLWVGILLVGAGAALVLFSKEEAESKGKAAHASPTPALAAANGAAALPPASRPADAPPT